MTITAESSTVRLFAPVSTGFRPLDASADELARHGFPARPDAALDPELFAQWTRVMSRSTMHVVPRFQAIPVGTEQDPQIPTSGTSANWAGSVAYALNNDSVVRVSGEWTVPDVIEAGPEYGSYACATWVGIDGWPGSDDGTPGELVQAGTTQQVDSFGFYRSRSTFTWWEWVPDGPHMITNVPVSAGDCMYCELNVHSSTEVAFYVQNMTTGVSTSFVKTAPKNTQLAGTTAEWIVELPAGTDLLGQPTKLARFGGVYFDNCTGRTEQRAALQPGSSELLTLTDSDGYPLAQPLGLTDTAIRVDYLTNPVVY